MAPKIDVRSAPHFDIESQKELYPQWKLLWEAFEELSGLNSQDNEDEKKKYRLFALRQCLSMETLRVVDSLPHLTEENKNDTGEIIKALELFITGQRNEIFERREFWLRNQMEGESFSDWYVAIKEMASRCNFERCCGKCAECQIRDKIVMGLRDHSTVEKLLEEGSELTLERAKTICESMESSKKNCTAMKGETSTISAVRRVSSYKKAKQTAAADVRQAGGPAQRSQIVAKHPICKFCGREHERGKEKCPAWGKSCTKCGKANHFAKQCRNGKPHKTSDNMNSIFAATKTENSEIASSCVRLSVKTDDGVRVIPALTDTGAFINAIPVKMLRTIGIEERSLCKSDIRPRAVDGRLLKSKGSIMLQVSMGETQVTRKFQVISGISTAILSREICWELRLKPESFPHQIVANISKPAGVNSAQQVMEEFSDVFSGKISKMAGEVFKIKISTDAKPFAISAPRRIAEPLKPLLKNELEELEREGIIARVTEPTEWCAPITVQPKKYRTKIRLCVDLRNLNKYVIRERYVSQTPFEVVSNIQTGAKFFTTVDAIKGYHQIPIDQESQLLTTFITLFGRYKYLRAPFGLSSISEHYNRRVDEVLENLKNTYHIVDDVHVLLAHKEFDEHLLAVREFLTRCRDRGVSLNPEKFVFAQPSVTFAGFRLDEDGYSVDPGIVRAIREFPKPENLTDLRAFFGLVNQVGFCSDKIASLGEPLRNLLKSKNDFLWDSQHDKAFDVMRQELSNIPTMAYYDQKRKTALHTDASRLNGLGFVLKQKQDDDSWKVVQAGSRFISETEKRYAMIELELLAVVWAAKRCRLFLEGLHQFDIVIDHKPLEPILNNYTLTRSRIRDYRGYARSLTASSTRPGGLKAVTTKRQMLCQERLWSLQPGTTK
ncbi:hypothetical protein BOX15_Mlig030097g1 [Macrostomum lignano]|uniref:Reverse transcriptase n=1 Tax=Macrostomum lignano TaxID=282301 RepID=A0A267F5E6_9PLAT|nr:hypothetical protein BOX15_Mlig030097g1 [Macrostomum lignano]